MGTIYENEAPVERVILVAISERDGDDTVASLEELAELAATAGAEVVGTVIQNLEHMNPGTYVGSGKLEEIRDMIWEKEAQFFCQHFFQVFLIFYFFCSFSTLYSGALIFHSLQSFAKTFAGYHHFCELVSHE